MPAAPVSPPLPSFPAGRDDPLTTPPAFPAQALALRAAIDADLPWLRALYATTRTDELARVPWPERVKVDFLDSQFALQHVHYVATFPTAEFLVIEQAGQPVGRYYLQRDGVDDLIVDISLFPASRGQGIAGALIGQTQLEAASRGRGITLHVNNDNPRAQALYARHGFVVTTERATHRGMAWPAPAG